MCYNINREIAKNILTKGADNMLYTKSILGCFAFLPNLINSHIPDNRPIKSNGIKHSSTSNAQMLKDMTGKSKAECRKILKKYGYK